jgi:NAD-dependent dihydropyrimidine dehydrogenase PreA subunit
MKRKIVVIDEEKCNGCGLCVPNCAEGAIKIIDGKAKLVSETYCDGLGACLGHCPMDAIHMEERDAAEYDHDAVTQHLKAEGRAPVPNLLQSPSHGHGVQVQRPAQAHGHGHQHHGGGCPGSAMRNLAAAPAKPNVAATGEQPGESLLGHWPVQLMLIPPHAPFLQGSDLVICADCVPFAVPDFHARYLNGRAVVIGCPKLDDLDHYREKIEAIFAQARPRRVTVLRMEVPCCGGIAHVALEAHKAAIPQTPLEIHIIGIRGGIVAQEKVG